jgi:arsenate reductase
MSDRVFNVLFLCTGNPPAASWPKPHSAKRSGALPRVQRREPSERERQSVRDRAAAKGRLSHRRAAQQSWDEFDRPDAPALDFVFTVCDNAAGEVCPIWPGQPVTAHWGVPDPAAVEGTELEKTNAFREAFTTLQRRIELFTSLPFASLDRMAIRDRVREIGKA